MTMADELQKLQTLREQGALTDEEFARAKQRILNESAVDGPTAPRAAAPAGGLHKLHRSHRDRWIGGVAGGLGELTDVPSWAWRILFVLTTALHGLGVLVYLAMWLFVPAEPVPSASPAKPTEAA